MNGLEIKPVWCVVPLGDGTIDVMRMRISGGGTLVGYATGRNSDAMFHLGSDRSRWPVQHDNPTAAYCELADRQSDCRHTWRHTDDEMICTRCGCVRPVVSEEDVAAAAPTYAIERCRSHEANSVPAAWERVYSGPEATVVREWWATYAGPQASGDRYRVVDDAGEEQMVGEDRCVGLEGLKPAARMLEAIQEMRIKIMEMQNAKGQCWRDWDFAYEVDDILIEAGLVEDYGADLDDENP